MPFKSALTFTVEAEKGRVVWLLRIGGHMSQTNDQGETFEAEMVAKKSQYPSRSTINRLTAAYKQSVGEIGGIEFRLDGTVRIFGAEHAKAGNSDDRDMGRYGQDATEGAYDRWKRQRQR